VANRRITEFSSVNGTSIVDEDLLTLVKVFEVDPTLKNKKLTFGEFRNYLDQYYGVASLSGDITLSGNLTITGDLTVEGDSAFVSGAFSDSLSVTNNVTAGNTVVATTITGNNIQGINGVFSSAVTTSSVTAQTVTTSGLTFQSGNFLGGSLTLSQLYVDNITGDTALFDNISGQVLVSGQTVVGVTGEFTQLNLNNAESTGTVDIKDLNVTGTLYVDSWTGTTVTGTTINATSGHYQYISGALITGDLITVDFASGISASYTNQLSGNSIIGQNVDAANGTFTYLNVNGTVTGFRAEVTTGIFEYISGAIITGDVINGSLVNAVTGEIGQILVNNTLSTGLLRATEISGTLISGVSGVFENLSGNTVTGTTINAAFIDCVSGIFTTLSGATITGDLANIGTGVFDELNAATLVYSGNETISGNFRVLGTTTLESGVTVTGESSFDDLVTFSGDIQASGITIFNESGTISGETIVGNTLISGADIATTGSVQTNNLQVTGVASGLNTTYNGFTIQGPLVILPEPSEP